MFSEQLVAQLAGELQQAEQNRIQVEHFSKRFPEMTVADGYAVSRAWVKLKIAQGRLMRGHKIGLTSRAMQLASQITEPDYGVAWLANKLAPWGEFLDKGEVVLGGSFTRPVHASAGDNFHVDYGALGAIAFRFV